MLFEQYGSSSFVKDRNSDSYREHLVTTVKGLARAGELLREKRFSIIVLDEILTLPQFGLLPEEKIIELIEMKPPEVELILTGRGAKEELIRRADLVTEMHEVKHYFSTGVIARKGIEY
jgi:cob(I)alamin adenosyltransferase